VSTFRARIGLLPSRMPPEWTLISETGSLVTRPSSAESAANFVFGREAWKGPRRRQGTIPTVSTSSGTDGSNPAPSSGESGANLISGRIPHAADDELSSLENDAPRPGKGPSTAPGRHPCSANSAAIRTRRPQKAKRSRRSGRLWAKATPAEIATTPPTASGIPKRQSTCPAPA
jgi:hypothetical protein